ncbi:class B sortase [Butyrivibrio sp. INlla14]|uniref:class B sortase n=1 Tax=Butyrivibrio sp. INlla14 TaxID=1520808 RepID=UPI0015A2D75B|nr:class B sortase [Butyrivibrio sp. INlla14]
MIFFASIFKGIRRHFVVVLAALLLILGMFAAVKLIPGRSESSGACNGPEVVETVSVASISEASSEADEAGDTLSSSETIDLGDAVTSTESTESSSKNGEKSSETKEIVDTIIIGEDVGQNISQEAFDKFVQRYTDTVGWLYFEDERLSYPIMRSNDNDKYAEDDYAGNESETGAIFLDFRCDPEFTDSNSIIYGHNMRNRTMFGALRIYKEDLSFLDQHKYFQIRTSNGISRYMIFAFMDVPKDSYIYDVYGKNPSNMREYLDTIEYKTYIDTGIEPTVDDQIVMLSTCTKSDDLYFVMFAVKVDE